MNIDRNSSKADSTFTLYALNLLWYNRKFDMKSSLDYNNFVQLAHSISVVGATGIHFRRSYSYYIIHHN